MRKLTIPLYTIIDLVIWGQLADPLPPNLEIPLQTDLGLKLHEYLRTEIEVQLKFQRLKFNPIK
jgi:hypothetical protein